MGRIRGGLAGSKLGGFGFSRAGPFNVSNRNESIAPNASTTCLVSLGISPRYIEIIEF